MADKQKTIHEARAGRVAKADFIGYLQATNPWGVTPADWANLDFIRYGKLVDECRFFYRFDPIVSTVINKMVDIGINDLLFSKNGLNDNEFRLFLALKPKLLEFAESMALEYFISGLIVPECTFGTATKEELMDYGVKKYDALTVPQNLWLRDPKTIIINSSMLSDEPTYYVQVPDQTLFFINNNGKYPDGTVDEKLYATLTAEYPEFVSAVKAGQIKVPLQNDHVIRRRVLPDSAYPIPYISSVLDILRHKRHLREMDYSIIDKVIGAIMHVQVGDKDFPILDSEEDKAFMDELQSKINWRFMPRRDLERIFQLITSHIVNIKWVFPDVNNLINDNKYQEVDEEILEGLGFPKILITGETTRTGASDPEIATRGPQLTLENMRLKVIEMVRYVCRQVADANGFKNYPLVSFKVLNMHNFANFATAIQTLYQSGSLSRQSYDEYFGYDFQDEFDRRVAEEQMIAESGVSPVGPSPFGSPAVQAPQQGGTPPTQPQNKAPSAPKSGENVNEPAVQ